jgi:hypothetical protein
MRGSLLHLFPTDAGLLGVLRTGVWSFARLDGESSRIILPEGEDRLLFGSGDGELDARTAELNESSWFPLRGPCIGEGIGSEMGEGIGSATTVMSRLESTDAFRAADVTCLPEAVEAGVLNNLCTGVPEVPLIVSRPQSKGACGGGCGGK